MKFSISPKTYTILGTYTRAFIAAAVSAYMMGHTGVKDLFAAGFASVIPVILRWANPADQFPAAQPSINKAASVVEGISDPLP